MYVASACLLSAAGLIACVFIGPSHPVLMMIVLILGIMGQQYTIAPTFWPLPTAMLSGVAAAGGIALINAVGNLGGFLGPYMFGLIKDATGGSDLIALLAIGAAPVISAIILVALGHDRRLERIRPEPPWRGRPTRNQGGGVAPRGGCSSADHPPPPTRSPRRGGRQRVRPPPVAVQAAPPCTGPSRTGSARRTRSRPADRSAKAAHPARIAALRCAGSSEGVAASSMRVYGCSGVSKIVGFRTLLDRLAAIHHQHVVRDVADHRQVVADEQIGQAELVLQVHHQVQHLRLDRNVERRDRFVGHHDPRPQHQRARDGDALALTAGEHVRIAAVLIRPQPDLGHHRPRRARDVRADCRDD